MEFMHLMGRSVCRDGKKVDSYQRKLICGAYTTPLARYAFQSPKGTSRGSDGPRYKPTPPSSTASATQLYAPFSSAILGAKDSMRLMTLTMASGCWSGG